MRKGTLIVVLIILGFTSCKKQTEHIQCSQIREQLNYLYITDSLSFEQQKAELWEKLDRLDCDKTTIKGKGIFNF